MPDATNQRILGIDPSLRGTGYGVIERSGSGHRAVTYGVIRNEAAQLFSGCLLAIRENLIRIIREWQPETVAIESTIFVQSYRTAITLGAARGAAVLAAAECGVTIYEYAPRSVKQAIVGRGGAQKDQVAFMIRALLKLTETPAPDAADALAVALAHAQATEAARHRQQPLKRL